MWVETQPSAQYSFQKSNVDTSCQKTRKTRCYIFWSIVQFYCFSLLCAKYLVQDCLSKQIFGRNLVQSPSHLNLWIFSVTSKHFSNHDKNIKQVSCVKSSKFNSFVLALFFILALGQNLTLKNCQICRLVVFWTN